MSFTPAGTPCYPNCDNSTIAPVLNVNVSCFLNRYAAGNSYANCDASTIAPVLNVNDFTCFVNRYAGAARSSGSFVVGPSVLNGTDGPFQSGPVATAPAPESPAPLRSPSPSPQNPPAP